MGSFVDSVAYLQPHVASLAIDADLSSFIGADERLTEAAAVEGCVGRAVVGELDSSGELAISRNRVARPWLPGLAWYMNQKGRFRSCGDQELRTMAEAVRRALGLGWLFACTPQAHAVARTERQIWRAWAPSVEVVSLGELLREDRLARRIKDDSGTLFRAELREANVIGRRGRLKVEMIGSHLATLGVLLRMAQTNEIGDDAFEINYPQTREGEDPGRWAWERYPETGTR